MERFVTKYDLLNLVYQDNTLKKTTKAVMQYLVALSDAEKCHPAVATIAGALGVSARTVQRHMRFLEKAGYLQRKSRYYRQEQLTNEYRFVLDFTTDKSTGRAIGKVSKDTLLQMDKEQVIQEGNQIEASDSCGQKKDFLKYIYKLQLKPVQKTLLIYLVHKSNQNAVCYGAIREICRELHISERLLRYSLRVLRQLSFIKIKSGCGKLVVKVDLEQLKLKHSMQEQKSNLKKESGKVQPEIRNRADIKIQEARHERKTKGWWRRKIEFFRNLIQGIRHHFLS